MFCSARRLKVCPSIASVHGPPTRRGPRTCLHEDDNFSLAFQVAFRLTMYVDLAFFCSVVLVLAFRFDALQRIALLCYGPAPLL